MLPVVFLAYDNGKFEPKTRFIKDWMTSDYDTCRFEKVNFVFAQFYDAGELVKHSFKDYKTLMNDACLVVQQIFIEYKKLAYVRKRGSAIAGSMAQLKGDGCSPQDHRILTVSISP